MDGKGVQASTSVHAAQKLDHAPREVQKGDQDDPSQKSLSAPAPQRAVLPLFEPWCPVGEVWVLVSVKEEAVTRLISLISFFFL